MTKIFRSRLSVVLKIVFMISVSATMMGCKAKVYSPLGMARPDEIAASLPKTGLRVGFYMETEAKNYSIDEYWVELKLGQIVYEKVDEYFPIMFKEVRHLDSFPPRKGTVDDFDVLITIDYATGTLQNTSGFAWSLDMSTKFNIHTPDNKIIRTVQEDSTVNFFMGSLNPSHNVSAAHKSADTIGNGIVLNFLRDLPVTDISAAVQAYKDGVSPLNTTLN